MHILAKVTYSEKPADSTQDNDKSIVVTFEKTLSCPALPLEQTTVNIDLGGDDDSSMIESYFEVKRVTFDVVKGVLKPIIYLESSFTTDRFKGDHSQQIDQIIAQFRTELVPNLKKCGWVITNEPYIDGPQLRGRRALNKGTLAEMVRATDLKTARLIWQKIHGTSADDLPFKDWMEVRAVVTENNSNIPWEVEGVLDEKASSFAEWLYLGKKCHYLYYFADKEEPPHPNKIRVQKIVKRLFETTTSFSECAAFLNFIEGTKRLSNGMPQAEEKLQGYALATTEKMVRFVATFEQWKTVYWRYEDGSEPRQKAFKHMTELAKTFEEWYFIFGQATTPKIKEEAVAKMAELAKS